MKKIILLSAVLAGLLISPVLILAADPPSSAPTVVSNPQDLLNLINKIGDWIFIFLLAVAAIFLIVAGFLYITAAADPAKIKTAREMLINALIGVVIALLARGVVQVIQSIIGNGV